MIGLVMAGGLGTRMRKHGEKLALGTRPMILRVIDAMIDSGLYERVIAATSKNSSQAHDIVVNDSRAEVMKTRGDGYVKDLSSVLSTLDGDVMIVPADLMLLDGPVLCKAHSYRTDFDAWTAIVSTAKFAESLCAHPTFFVDVDNVSCAYTGVSIVNASLTRDTKHIREDLKILDDRRIALNVNTPDDYKASLDSLIEP